MAFKSRLPEIAAAIEIAVKEAEKAAAEKIAQSAKDRVPVDTGKLRDAIHTEDDPETGGVYVIAGDKEAFYGHIVEHGGVNHPPHPFLVPALEENRAEVEGLVREAIRKAT